MKILIVVDMQKDFISGPLGTAEARAIVPYVAEKAKNTPRENLFVTLDTHQPNYMETIDAALCACVTPESHDTALNAMRLCQMEILHQGEEPWRK